MTDSQVELRLLYNPTSGTGLAKQKAEQALAKLSEGFPIYSNVFLGPVGTLLPPSDKPQLNLIFGGDGSFFRSLQQSLGHPDCFILPVGCGSENAAARFLGTQDLPINQLLKRIFSYPQLADAFTPVSPWQAENLQNGQITNFFWLFGVGGSVIGQLLVEVEKVRCLYPDPNLRLAQAFLGLVTKEPSLPFQETLFVTGILPSLARFPLSSPQPQLVEFPAIFRGIPVSILSASVLAFIDIGGGLTQPAYLKHQILTPSATVQLTNRGPFCVVDSEIHPNDLGAEYLIHPSPSVSPFVWFPKPIQD